MKLSAVLVHYHAPDRVAAAIRSLERGITEAGEGWELEILVVDNGSRTDEAQALGRLPGRVLEPGRNTGYAGGLNLGVEAAGGDLLVLANPDLELMPGALPRLLSTAKEAEAGHGAAIVGPAFHWDRAGRILLPPAERRDRWSDLLSRLAPRGPRWARLARRRWRRHARRHWLATRPLPSPWLSGALLVATRQAWRRTGPFDAGYPLYFEETDWLLRARRAGVPVLYEPRARVHHEYAGSTAGDPRAAAWFAESEARFSRQWYGPLHRRLRRLLSPAGTASGRTAQDVTIGSGQAAGCAPRLSLPDDRASTWWLEISPAEVGFPAAAEKLSLESTEWTLPADLADRIGEAPWRLRLVDGAGRERTVPACAPAPSS